MFLVVTAVSVVAAHTVIQIKPTVVPLHDIRRVHVFTVGIIGILIGPEGGFEEEEIRRLTEQGCRTVSLGTRILRTETAGMAVLAQILYELES